MFQGDGNTVERKKFVNQPVSSEKTYEREPVPFQNYPPTKEMTPPISNVSNILPYRGMYQQPPPMHYPGYMMPQTNQPPQTYPPSDMYYMPNLPNMYYPNNGKE